MNVIYSLVSVSDPKCNYEKTRTAKVVAVQGAVSQLGDIYHTVAVCSPQVDEFDESKEMIAMICQEC